MGVRRGRVGLASEVSAGMGGFQGIRSVPGSVRSGLLGVPSSAGDTARSAASTPPPLMITLSPGRYLANVAANRLNLTEAEPKEEGLPRMLTF